MAISPTSVTLSYLSYCPTYTLPSKTTRTTKTEGTSNQEKGGGYLPAEPLSDFGGGGVIEFLFTGDGN